MLGLRTRISLFAAAVLLVAPVEANTTYYAGTGTQEGLFNTAVTGWTLLDPALTFSGTPGSTGLLNASGMGIDFLGFNDFSSLTPETFTVNSGTGTLTAAFPNDVTEIAFPAAGVYAFGFHFTTASGFANWCIDLTTSGCDNAVAETAPTVQFFGFVSNTPVTAPLYIRSATSGAKIVFTDFEVYADPVPEPRTMLLVGLGLVILPLVRWKKPRQV